MVVMSWEVMPCVKEKCIDGTELLEKLRVRRCKKNHITSTQPAGNTVFWRGFTLRKNYKQSFFYISMGCFVVFSDVERNGYREDARKSRFFVKVKSIYSVQIWFCKVQILCCKPPRFVNFLTFCAKGCGKNGFFQSTFELFNFVAVQCATKVCRLFQIFVTRIFDWAWKCCQRISEKHLFPHVSLWRQALVLLALRL